ncbi:MAG: hypothetical protein HC889_10995, partial [Synechococcaceae cyanobacterium SM1_2_3]|nr:hypothetical protein [Synechococcaceae cyanobacterium SM1_2_3]
QEWKRVGQFISMLSALIGFMKKKALSFNLEDIFQISGFHALLIMMSILGIGQK